MFEIRPYSVTLREVHSGSERTVIPIPAPTMSDAVKMAKILMMRDVENEEQWVAVLAQQLSDVVMPILEEA